MRRLILLMAMGVTSFLIVITTSIPNGIAQTIPSRVQEVYNSTEAQTEVPLMLPSIIPLGSPAAPSEYWAFSIAPDKDGYSISFDRAEDCSNVEECSFAVASGKVRSNTDQTLASLIERSDVTGAEEISLSNGTNAVYVPAQEGIYMPSNIYWDVDEYRYRIGIYMGEKDEVLEMANSAVQAN